MAQPLTVNLTRAQRQELESVRDQHQLAFMRERAAAILKVANGETARQVALNGLHKKRDPDTIYRWIHRYLAEGIEGLYIRAGRGRKAAFSPCVQRRNQRKRGDLERHSS